MKVSKTTLVIATCKDLSSTKYCYRSLIKGAIQCVKEKYGYECDEDDASVCDAVIEAMQKISEAECNIPFIDRRV